MFLLAGLHGLPPVSPPVLVHRRDVGSAAWFALRRDGVLRALRGDVALRTDVPESPELRAAAVAHLVPPRAVVGRRSAAWIHLGGAPPARVDLLFEPHGRRTGPHPELVAAEAHLDPDDVVLRASVRVTSPLRTAVDVARLLPPVDAEPLLAGLVAAGVAPEAALEALDRAGGARGARQARRLLTAVAAPAGRPPTTASRPPRQPAEVTTGRP